MNLRKEAAAALGEIADASGRPYLEAVEDDPDPDVRKTVRWALTQIDGFPATRKIDRQNAVENP